MTETIVGPDCVAVTRTYLAASLTDRGDTDTHVGARVGGQAKQVVLTLIDSSLKDLVIHKSTLRVDCWADETLGQEVAADLGLLTRGLLGAMQGTVQSGTTVYRVTDVQPGLNDAPDPVSGKARYSFHVSISMRGLAL